MDTEEQKEFHPPRLDLSTSEGALPDGLEEASRLEHLARKLASAQDPQAQRLRQQARESFFKELNELDGFDR